MEIAVSHYVVLACVLFAIGVYGVITRKNILIVLMCLELMLNSCNLLFVVFSRLYEGATGHVFVLMSVTVAAAEVRGRPCVCRFDLQAERESRHRSAETA